MGAVKCQSHEAENKGRGEAKVYRGHKAVGRLSRVIRVGSIPLGLLLVVGARGGCKEVMGLNQDCPSRSRRSCVRLTTRRASLGQGWGLKRCMGYLLSPFETPLGSLVRESQCQEGEDNSCSGKGNKGGSHLVSPGEGEEEGNL